MPFDGAITGLAVLGIKTKFDGVDEKFKSIGPRLDAINSRFDDMSD
jgi:hypothetical protein